MQEFEDQKRTSLVYDELVNIINQNDPFLVPPNEGLLDDFQTATNTGYVEDPSRGREPFSLMFRDNQPFKITTSSDKFSQMSIGYTMIFLYSKFTVWFALIPLLLYGIAMMVIYAFGDACVDQDSIDYLVSNVKGFKDMDLLNKYIPGSPVPNTLQRVYNEPGTDSTFTKYQYLNCFIVKNTPKCNELSQKDCSANYSEDCEKVNVEAYTETYIDGQCDKNFIAMISAGNGLYPYQMKAILIVQTIAVLLMMLSICIFYYYHEEKTRTYSSENNTIENYSALLCNLREASGADLEASVMPTMRPPRNLELQNSISELFKKHNLPLASINFLYDTEDLIDNQKRMTRARRQRAKDIWVRTQEQGTWRGESVFWGAAKIPSAARSLSRANKRRNEVGTVEITPAMSVYPNNAMFDMKNRRVPGYAPGPRNSQPVELDLFQSFNENADLSIMSRPESVDIRNNERLTENIHALDSKISYIEQAITADQQEYSLGPKSDLFLGAAFISFHSTEDKIKALSIFERKGWLYNLFGFGPIQTKIELLLDSGIERYQLWLEKAYAPQDIIWEHLGYSKISKFWRSVGATTFSIVLVTILFFAFLALKLLGLWISGNLDKRNNTKSFIWSLVANGLVSTIINLVDLGLQWLFIKVSSFEKHSTITILERNVTRRIWKTQFVTSGLIPAAIAILLLNFYGAGGMIYTIHFIFIGNLVLTPIIIVYLDFPYYWKLYQQFRVKKFIHTLRSGRLTTQEEANEIFLGYDFNLAFCYSLMLKNLALACFFATIFPLGVVYCLLQMIIYYWCFKWMLVTFSNKVRAYSDKISRDLIHDLELCMLLFVWGMIYERIVAQLILVQSFSVSLLHIALLVATYIFTYFNIKRYGVDFLQQSKPPNVSYIDLQQYDPNNYQLFNPAKPLSTSPNRPSLPQAGLVYNSVAVQVLPYRDLYKIDKEMKRGSLGKTNLNPSPINKGSGGSGVRTSSLRDAGVF